MKNVTHPNPGLRTKRLICCVTQTKNGTETEGIKIEMTDRNEQKFLSKKSPLNEYQWACLFTPEQRSLAEVGLSTANVAHQSNIALPNP
ncbi:hypothetical protein [Pantoea sp. Taur]|uniref:hypothetical protein n=1 Tax=Pantoea sp. Taur TaxID=2576757 RepID=UPI001927E294|nr:hypothetical protein [Pantoea sp. Taur]